MTRSRAKALCHATLAALLLSLAVAPVARSERSQVEVPINFDYPLLRQLLVRQLFDEPGESAEILHDPSACNRVVLSSPRLTPRGDELELLSSVDAKLGVPFSGGCNVLLSWQGGVGFLGRPQVKPNGTAVNFQPSSTWLIAADGTRTTSGALWDMAEGSLLAFFAGFTLDLAPYIESLSGLLPDVLPHRSAQELQSIVNSLTLGKIQVAPASLNTRIHFEIASLTQSPRAEASLSDEELRQWETRWQLMDTVLVMAVKHYAAATGQQVLRDALLDILIGSRYRLRDALGSAPDRGNDAVRSWFLDSWKRLGPIMRSIALEQPGQEHLLLLSILSATDALDALDELGPGIGLDISTNGLKRLARMINEKQGEEMLRYDEAVDPELQQLFQQKLPPETVEPSALNFNFSLLPQAHAAPPYRLNNWVPSSNELGEYLPQVADVLGDSSGKMLAKYPLDPAHKKLFHKLVLATAWQESCWRQYVVKDKKIVPLRSYSGDVGLMQINEKVWRGFYDIQKLRWDIKYNSNAGAEILLDYLVKYALKQGEQKHSGGQANLARASYSAYNGGPSQVSRYRRSKVPSAHKKIDEAFWGKYRQVDAGNAMNVAQCLGAEAPVAKKAAATRATPPKPVQPKPAAVKTAVSADSGKSWVLAQRESDFTLQLGAFSTREAALKFIGQQGIPAPTHVYTLHKSNGRQYLVLHGVFASRGAADPIKRKFAGIKPWLRTFGDLR